MIFFFVARFLVNIQFVYIHIHSQIHELFHQSLKCLYLTEEAENLLLKRSKELYFFKEATVETKKKII